MSDVQSEIGGPMHRGVTALRALFVAIGVTGLAAAAAWTQEPDGLLGVTLGKSFPPASVIGDCPAFEQFRREPIAEELCVDTRAGFSADAIALRYAPLGSVLGTARVTLRDGLVESIAVNFDRRSFAQVKALLVERHGPPHAQNSGESGETLRWSGAHVVLALHEATDSKAGPVVELRETRGAAP